MAEPFSTEDIQGWADTFDGALAYLQQHLPRVAKGETAEVIKDGRKLYDYQYADLTDVTEAILPLLGRLGLSWSCRPTLMQLPGETVHRFVLAYRLRHVSRDEESGYWPLPDRADPQTVGSAITYARRYCLCAVTGLAPGGDDDGTAARDASKRGETLTEASTLSLPPNVTEYLVALLEPQALTPLAEYASMWAMVTKGRAAGKPSPVEHDGRILTWAELFGFSLAQRIEALTTPTQCRAFYDEARAAKAELPWPWEDQLPSTRLLARGARLREELDERAKVVELAITSASNRAELTAAAELAEELGRAAPDKLEGLRLMVAARVAEVDAQQSEPDSSDPRDEHWEQVDAETDAQHDAPAVAAQTHLEGGPAAVNLMARIWRGNPLGELAGEFDGAFERGEVSGDEHAALHEVLASRPEPGPDGTAYDFLVWQAETAPAVAALDDLSKRAKALGALNRPDIMDARQRRALSAAISARRTELSGERYR